MLQRLNLSQSRTQLPADRVALEVPRHVLADVAASVVLVVEEVDEQLGVPAERVGDESEGGIDRVRLGAHLSPGTTVMHEGFCNFNAGTLGNSMVEGRISQGVIVGEISHYILTPIQYDVNLVPTVYKLNVIAGLRLLDRSKVFLRRAGTVILGIAVALWVLSSLPLNNGQTPPIAESFAGTIGHIVEPVIRPLGFNWKIGIGLVAAQAAREVFCGTMAVVYNVERKKGDAPDTTHKQHDGSEIFHARAPNKPCGRNSKTAIKMAKIPT